MTTTSHTQSTRSQHQSDNSHATISDAHAHIYNLIQQNEIFKAKLHMQLINDTNGYNVISKNEFKQMRIQILKSNRMDTEYENRKIKIDLDEKHISNIKVGQNHFSNIKSCSNRIPFSDELKNENENNRIISDDNRKIKMVSDEKRYSGNQKLEFSRTYSDAYMKLING